MLADDEVLLRQPFHVECSSTQEARNLHKRFAKITTLKGNTVFFSRSIRIREAKTLVRRAAQKP